MSKGMKNQFTIWSNIPIIIVFGNIITSKIMVAISYKHFPANKNVQYRLDRCNHNQKMLCNIKLDQIRHILGYIQIRSAFSCFNYVSIFVTNSVKCQLTNKKYNNIMHRGIYITFARQTFSCTVQYYHQYTSI